MKADIINPFIESIINVLSTMANTTAQQGKIFLKKDNLAKGDVTGIIGMAGEKAKGSLAISFTEPVILHVASNMLGEKYTTLEPIVIDMVSEIVNMVLGSVKNTLAEKGYIFDMSIPSTISGHNHNVSHKTIGPVIIVPFMTSIGDFFIEVCFESWD
jgi:chemotaxis protein CheX